jgi:hypothetical protein
VIHHRNGAHHRQRGHFTRRWRAAAPSEGAVGDHPSLGECAFCTSGEIRQPAILNEQSPAESQRARFLINLGLPKSMATGDRAAANTIQNRSPGHSAALHALVGRVFNQNGG